MTKHLVLVAGNIGAGKTSLAERLGERLNWHVAYESVDDNPYLPDFYADMRTWSFHLQVFFLGHRAEQHCSTAALPRSAVIDRSIYEDAHIFARALYAMGNMAERDYHAYRRLYTLVIEGLPRPDLLIYIQASAPTLMARIQKRSRAIESGLSADYLALLGSFYDEWISAFDLCPVLTIPGDELDFVQHPQHLDVITEHVLDRLAGKESLVFHAQVKKNAG
ncbi:MAG: deoxynucleoside kinase [Anaerolineae bacterium]|nr:deoxynucleoside kinase [Anaerolineae bacterium]